MSSGLGKGIGIPVKLLHEAEGHTVTVRPLLDSILDARTRASAARSRGRARASPSLSGGRDRAASRRKKTYSFFIFVRGDRRSILPPSLLTRSSTHPAPPVVARVASPSQIELKNGETYRGTLLESEDNWNCQLEGITQTGRDGRVNQLEHAYIRGSKIRFLVIPDMLKNAPMFKRIDPRAGGGGRGGRGGGGRGGGGRGGRGGRGQ